MVYLKHRVDGEGLHTTDHKVAAVFQASQQVAWRYFDVAARYFEESF